MHPCISPACRFPWPSKVVEERKRRAVARRSDKAREFRRWAQLKEMTEEAVRCLRDIDPPGEGRTRAARERWLEVGRGEQSRVVEAGGSDDAALSSEA